MPGLFIAGTGTDIGKTYVTAALARALRAQGRSVEALKPVVSGFDPRRPAGSDPAILLDAMGVALSDDSLERMSPWRFAAPVSPPLAARMEGRSLEASDVVDLCRRRVAAAGDGVLLVEGAGGVMSPLDDDHTMLDLIAALDLPTLLVAGSYLGSISHTLTALHVLRARTGQRPAIVVSESLAGPSLDSTLGALERLAPEVPIFAVPRGGQIPPSLLRQACGGAAQEARLP